MIIQNARSINTGDPSSFAWAGLRRSQNVELMTDKLMQLHSIPAKQRHNARKQAAQIRYCLVQAREYFAAASNVSLATKPNLLYYGTMSLALAEILFKQSGDSSLDKAREENRHHGLTMSVGGFPKSPSLLLAAQQIKAHPVVYDGQRRGTFELWHRSSREHPLVGLKTDFLETGGSTSSYYVIYGAADETYDSFPALGMTLADILAGVPELAEEIAQAGIQSNLIRGTAKLEIHHGPQWWSHLQILLHPNPLCAEAIDQICVAPRDIESVSCVQIGDGYELKLNNNWVHTVSNMPIPPAASTNTKEWRMWTNKPVLNEFGYFYVALYLAGNYARYYPDKWLADVETSSPLALAIERLCDLSEWRAPWLTLCELDLTVYLRDV
jgi:hypothetical protein